MCLMFKISMYEYIPEREARAFGLDIGDIIFITQSDGAFYAYQNLCPDLQVDLEFLEIQFLDRDQEFIECSTHGALFLVESGECISGPCQGQSLEKVEITVHSDGGIYLT